MCAHNLFLSKKKTTDFFSCILSFYGREKNHMIFHRHVCVISRKTRCSFIYFILFIQYFTRVTHLAVIAILPCGPLCKGVLE